VNQDEAVGLLNEWAKQPGADPHLLAAARGELLDILDRLVSNDMTAQAVGSADGIEAPSLMLVGTTGILDVSVAGPPDEPVIEVELLHVKLPPIGVTLTDKLEASEAGAGRRREWTWVFDFEGRPPVTVTHFGAADAHGQQDRLAFALKIAYFAGWPLPTTTSNP
jgi:hypothetical protein